MKIRPCSRTLGRRDGRSRKRGSRGQGETQKALFVSENKRNRLKKLLRDSQASSKWFVLHRIGERRSGHRATVIERRCGNIVEHIKRYQWIPKRNKIRIGCVH